MDSEQDKIKIKRAAISPMLSVRNGKQAIEFYKKALGAKELFSIANDADEVVAQLSVSGAEFWLADESPEHLNFSPETLGGSTTRIVIIVEDPKTVFENAIAAGAKMISPVGEQNDWLIGRIADPFGHHWEIGKPLTM